MIKTYSEMARYSAFEDRFEYLKLGGVLGNETFGFDRHINQAFYTSREWRRVRQQVIVRDNGCDLGVLGFEIHVDLLVHHINPMTPEDIVHDEEWIFNPEYLITTSKSTHNAIHFGTGILRRPFVERRPGDTKLW